MPNELTTKQLRKLFVQSGFRVEKLWFRSVAVVLESKLPSIKAKILTNTFGDQKDNKNAYVLLTSPEQAKLAAEKLNQTSVDGKHIRVDLDYKEEGSRNANDYECTAFIGNLPFIVNEEDVRDYFMTVFKGQEDPIRNVRLIRDPQTFIGKGIGYVQFKDKLTMRKAIEELHEQRFQGRPLRMKKAVEPKRLDKKKRRTAEKVEFRKQ